MKQIHCEAGGEESLVRDGKRFPTKLRFMFILEVLLGVGKIESGWKINFYQSKLTEKNEIKKIIEQK